MQQSRRDDSIEQSVLIFVKYGLNILLQIDQKLEGLTLAQVHFAGGHENKEGLLPAIREAELEASVQGIDGDREFPHDETPHPCQLQLFLKIKAHLLMCNTSIKIIRIQFIQFVHFFSKQAWFATLVQLTLTMHSTAFLFSRTRL